MSDLDKTYAEIGKKALKILGPKAKLPSPANGFSKAVGAACDLDDDAVKQAKTIETATQEFVNLIVKLKSEMRRFDAAIQKADFGLDLKDSKKAKIAAEVRKYYQSNFDKLNEYYDAALDKAEAQLDSIQEAAKTSK